ncbi:MAG: hypothetical protein AB1656_02530 [Candidatus Omnitrophota bacterium]
MMKGNLNHDEVLAEISEIRKAHILRKKKEQEVKEKLGNESPALQAFVVFEIPDSTVAKICGFSQQSVSNWRIGKQKIPDYAQLVMGEVLHLFMQDFLSDYDDPGFAWEGISEEDEEAQRKQFQDNLKPKRDYLEALLNLQSDIIAKIPTSEKIRALSHLKKLEEENGIS